MMRHGGFPQSTNNLQMDKINPKKDHKKPKINQSPKNSRVRGSRKSFFFLFITLKNRLILWIAWLIHSAHDSLLKVEVPYAFSETFQSNENFVTSWTKVLLKKTHSMSIIYRINTFTRCYCNPILSTNKHKVSMSFYTNNKNILI